VSSSVSGHLAGVADERLHLALAEVARAGTGEPAAEALGPGHADGRAVDVDHRGLALQHADAGGLEPLAEGVRLAGVVVVVAEHGDHGQVERADGPADEVGLVRLAAAAEVAGEQEEVGVPLGAGDAPGEGLDVVGAEVDVPDGGDPDHVMRSVVWRSVGSATSTTASCRSALVTAPET
jgi:hypothetical protein